MRWQYNLLWIIVALHPLFRYWILPYPPIGPDRPGPVPWSILLPALLAIVGGVAGGWVFYNTWVANDRASGVEAASTALGAYVGATFLLGVYRLTTRGAAIRESS
jgi:uncharacterized membrane protein YeaQ/YmgE (transglycosylase-associated protein family)